MRPSMGRLEVEPGLLDTTVASLSRVLCIPYPRSSSGLYVVWLQKACPSPTAFLLALSNPAWRVVICSRYSSRNAKSPECAGNYHSSAVPSYWT